MTRMAWASMLGAVFMGGCTAPVYPTRPEPKAGPPVVDLEPTKVAVHVTSTLDGLSMLFESALPQNGEGELSGPGSRRYFWSRSPIALKVADGKIQANADLDVGLELPLVGRRSLTFELTLRGEPVITSDYQAVLQGATIELEAGHASLRAANAFLGVLEIIKGQLQTRIDTFRLDLGPTIQDAFAKYAAPYSFALGDASACLALRLSALEAGPTVLAGGFEKDIAFTVAPSVTIPCAPPDEPPSPPRLANVPSLPTGAFTVTVPIAAKYDELQKAASLAFTDGRLYFSEEHPELYVDRPEIYAADGRLVLKVHIGGSLSSLFSPSLDGDIYFVGHPQVVDNQLTVPDLEPTVDTSNFLLGLAASLGSGKIRDSIRQALVLDIGARLGAVREMMSRDFTFADGLGCLRTDVAKIAVTNVFAHAAYMRMYVAVTAQAGVYIPCPGYAPLEGPMMPRSYSHGVSGADEEHPPSTDPVGEVPPAPPPDL